MSEGLQADIAVIGAGPGGYVAALRAAQQKSKVVVIEKDEVGGTCLNRGCIPTKALLASVEVLEMSSQARAFGLAGEPLKPDLAAMIARKDRIVKQLVNGIKFLFKTRQIELVQGLGKIVSPETIEVARPDGSKTSVKAGKIIIATGSEPAKLPGFEPDGQTVITSTDALKMTSLPANILIIGAGAIGCEFAVVFSRLGAQVTIVEMLPQILPTEDEEIAGELRKIFEMSGIKIFTGVKVEKTEKLAGGRTRVALSNGQAEETDRILLGVGRSFNTTGIGLEELNVRMDRKAVAVNEKMETSVPGVYAIGDVTGKILLAHVASHQGLVAVANILGEGKSMDYTCVPGCIYTRPEVASVGLSEKKAREKSQDITVGKFPFAANGKAVCIGEAKGMVKIVADSKTRKVLGVHIVGPHATDLIAEAVLAIKSGCTTEEITETIHAHPTLSETVMEAAEVAQGTPIHIV